MAFSVKIDSQIRITVFIAICINLGEILNGYAVAWSAPVLPKFEDPEQSPLSCEVTEMQIYWVGAAVMFGQLGAFSGGYLGNLIGRKKALIAGGVVYLCANIMLTFAANLTTLIIGRYLVGTCICALMTLQTMYIGETASPNIRGRIMTSLGVAHASGSLLAYCVGPFVNFTCVGYVVTTLNIVFVCLCCFLPESPMYFVLKDDENAARLILSKLHKSININTELKAMMEVAREQKNTKHIWKELYELKSNRKSIFITVPLAICQQGSGIIAVVFYANSIFRYAGSSIHPDIATIIVGITFVVGAIVAPMFIDKYGRRILLMLSTSILSVSMAGLGIYFYLSKAHQSSVEKLGWLPLLLLVIAQFSYSFGLSVIPNMLPGELFSPRVRGLGSSISICSGMITGFLSNFLFSYIVIALGIHYTFFLFAIVNALGFIFVAFVVPETMGKSLMEIQNMLGK